MRLSPSASELLLKSQQASNYHTSQQRLPMKMQQQFKTNNKKTFVRVSASV